MNKPQAIETVVIAVGIAVTASIAYRLNNAGIGIGLLAPVVLSMLANSLWVGIKAGQAARHTSAGA